MPRRIFPLLITSLALAGCNMATQESAQYDDSRNPNVKQAQQDADAGQPAAAVTDYEAALAANPKLAEAYYEIGKLDADKLNDPVGAVYNFKRYLDLSPSSPKADEVRAQIDQQSTAFASSLPNSPAQNAQDYAQLQGDNAALKKQLDDANTTIAQMQTELAKPGKHRKFVVTAPITPASESLTLHTSGPLLAQNTTTNAPGTMSDTTTSVTTANTTASDATMSTNAAPSGPMRAAPVDQASAAAGDASSQASAAAGDASSQASAPTTVATAPTGPSRSYTVVKGDSYWKIAKKMYKHDTKNGSLKIQDANPETKGKPLKIGQVLVIPA